MTGPSRLDVYAAVARGEITAADAQAMLATAASESADRAWFPLSYSQRSLWIVSETAPGNAAYNVPIAYRVDRNVDIAALQRALRSLGALHPALRTVLSVRDGVPGQSVEPQVEIGITARSTVAEGDALVSELRALARRPFDLERGPLVRATLLTGSSAGPVLLLELHHLIVDGVSVALLLEQLEALYIAERDGAVAEIEPPAGTYADFVAWQRLMVDGEGGASHLDYWRDRLVGATPVDLPTDRPRPALPGYRGASLSFEIAGAGVSNVRECARDLRASVFSVVTAAFVSLLHRYTRQGDLVVGTPIESRPKTVFEDIVGLFMNMVALRVDLSDAPTFAEAVIRVDSAALGALEHSAYPLLALHERTRDSVTPVGGGIVRVALYYQNEFGGLVRDGLTDGTGAGLLREPVYGVMQEGEFELTLEVLELDDVLRVNLKYDPDIFDEETAARFGERFTMVLQRATSAPGTPVDEIPLMGEAERRYVLEELNATATEYPADRCVHELISAQALRTPAAEAVRFGEEALTYAELELRTDTFAAILRERGAGVGVVVGVLVERSIDLLVALLGTLKTGAAYLPLDPVYPADRIEYMLETASAPLIVTQSALQDRLGVAAAERVLIDALGLSLAEGAPISVDGGRPGRDDLAYVIFTSGSTGKPKGVEVMHGGLTNFLVTMAERPGMSAHDTILALTTICFDIAALELYLPLTVGGRVIILPDSVAKDGIELRETIERGEATVVQATPATWQMLLAAGWPGTPGLRVLVGGEALSEQVAAALLGRAAEVWNVYGPTETTIWSSVALVTDASAVTLGLPIANTAFYVLDDHLEPVPTGIAGELYIGGDGVARGYIARPELTAERFLPDPFAGPPGARMYRTGDMVRHLASGEIVYLGRVDQQVKLRGFRVELGEVESALLRVDGVCEVTAVVRTDDAGHPALIAFAIADGVTRAAGSAPITSAVMEWLPDYMVPSLVVFVSAFPMTLNRKVDRGALTNEPMLALVARFGCGDDGAEAPVGDPPKSAVPRDEPAEHAQAALEQELLTLAAEITGRDASMLEPEVAIGEYGFDSIRFTTLAVQLRDRFGAKVSPTAFFTHTSAASIAAYLLREYPEVRARLAEGAAPTPAAAVAPTPAAAAPIACGSSAASGLAEEPIAVIGMAGRLPGSEDLDGFWESLAKGRDCVSDVPADRWDHSAAGPDAISAGGFLAEIDRFDPLFFGISPTEAESMDPQQRLFIEAVWWAIEDAGYRASALAGSRTGMFVGASTPDYLVRFLRDNGPLKLHTMTGLAPSIIANRVSYLLDLHGPSMVIDTACSSSLVAVHRAVRELRAGACELAIAGGVNVIVTPLTSNAASLTGMLSPDGRCKTFSADADGYGRGEGVGAVVLKPLSRALADGDNVYAVIRGSAENHGGRTHSLTVPNPSAQSDLIRDAYASAGIDPTTVTYIETHGTGTKLGDPIEVEGLAAAFKDLYAQWGQEWPGSVTCGIGSVKSNVGHLETAAGIAGLLKVLLAMREGVLPATIHADELNPLLELDGTPFFVTSTTALWDAPCGVRRAGISSFGFGGANAHVVLEAHCDSRPVVERNGNAIVLSARDGDRLEEQVRRLHQFLREAEAGRRAVSLSDVAFTLQTGREELPERLAFVADDVPQAITRIEDFLAGDVSGVFRARAVRGARGGQQDAEAGDPYSLAARWVTGETVDWLPVWGDERPRRVPLPGYPFARERYWLAGESTGTPAATPAAVPDSGDPGERASASASISSIAMSVEIASDDPVLAHHFVAGRPVFPGMGYLDLVLAAWRGLPRGVGPVRLAEVNWLTPLVGDGVAVTLRVAFDDSIVPTRFTVASGDIGASVVHCTGTIASLGAVAPTTVDLSAAAARAVRRVEPAECYPWFASVGVAYGDFFRVVEWCTVSEHESLARIALPVAATGPQRSGLHPAFADGALQTMAATAAGSDADLAVPFGIAELLIYGDLPVVGYGHGVMRGERRYDVSLTDDAGAVLVQMNGVSLRPFRAQAAASMCFLPQWGRAPLPDRTAVPALVSPALIAHTPDGAPLAHAIAARWPAEEVTLVDVSSKDWLDAVSTTVAPRAVYFLGAIDLSEDVCTPDTLGVLEERTVLDLFRLVKSLPASSRDSLAFTAVTNDVCDIDATLVRPVGGLVHGFMMSLAAEQPSWRISVVDAGAADLAHPAALAHGVLAEPARADGSAVALRAGSRYMRTLVPVELPPSTPPPLRRGGVYVIAGGAGGIGLEIARYFVRTAGARVVLLGRSELGETARERIATIGGSVTYIRADITDLESCAAAFERVRSEMGPIAGVVHSAIVLEDETVERMDEASLRRVLAPKVRGAVVLDSVIGDDPLDFVLYLSSVQPFVANPGQSNYAAACAFKDAFARHQAFHRPFAVRTVNWGYWGSVGIVSDERYQRLMALQGVTPIDVAEGMETIVRVLAAPVPQVVSVEAADALLDRAGVRLAERAEVARPAIVCDAVEALASEVPPDIPGSLSEMSQALEASRGFYRSLLLDYFRSQGTLLASGESHTFASLKERLGVVPDFDRLFPALVGILERAGILVVSGEQLTATDAVVAGEGFSTNDAREELLGAYPELESYVTLLCACLAEYPRILRGEVPATDVMFPGSSMRLVGPTYRDNLRADFFNQLLRWVVTCIARVAEERAGGAPLRVLEVGAGTGGTSSGVLSLLAESGVDVQYTYTDMSRAFVAHGQRTFGALPFVDYRVLDIEGDLAAQGFVAGAYDLVIAANVLHATRAMDVTIDNIRRLLAAGGVLVLNEVTEVNDFTTLTFGLLDGWWLYTDPELRLPDAPLLGVEQWRRLLATHGFLRVRAYGDPGVVEQDMGQSIIVAEGDGVSLLTGRAATKEETIGRRHVTQQIDGKSQLDVEQAVTADSLAPAAHPAATGVAPVNVTAAAFDAAEASRLALETVTAIVSELASIPSASLDTDANMSEFGLDSLLMTALATRIGALYGIEFAPSVFFEHQSLSALAGHLADEYLDQVAAHHGLARTVTSTPVEPAVPIAALAAPVSEAAPYNSAVAAAPVAPSAVDSAEPTTPPASAVRADDPIAIVGMSGIMPRSENLDEFWTSLVEGADLITEVPADRWDWRAIWGDPSTERNKTRAKWGAFMKEIDKFDPLFFGISPKEAQYMDPQQRLFLETAYHTIEDAGYRPSSFAGSNMGVFVGVAANDYGEVLLDSLGEIRPLFMTGAANSVVAARVSYSLDLHGPSEPVNTACSSALVAMHRAILSIKAGDCDVAIAGGVNALVTPTLTFAFGSAGLLSPDGKCRTFDKDANGYVRAEGCGAVMLKPLSRARADGDHVYAIVRGSAVNHVGRANSITAPNPNAQADCLIDAYTRADVDPSEVGFIEAHGTGTELGDPVEVTGLKKAFRELYRRRGLSVPTQPRTAIGTVKTSVGHLETGAGIAGVLKVLLSMKHRMLPGNMHFREINPYISLADTPFEIVSGTRDWKPLLDTQGRALPRRAGISSFGFSGVNAHLVLEEGEAPARAAEPVAPNLFVLSARSRERLEEYARIYRRFLEREAGCGVQAEDASGPLLADLLAEEAREAIASVVDVPASVIDLRDDLDGCGLDTLGARAFAHVLSERIGIALSLVDFTAYGPIAEALRALASDHATELLARYPGSRLEAPPAPKPQLSLADIAWTMQVGRDEFDERLAIVATSADELHEGLGAFLEDSADSERLHTGNARTGDAGARELIEGEEGRQFIAVLARSGGLAKLARLWVAGVGVDWQLLHGGAPRVRVPLPVYPFERMRCWIEREVENGSDGSVLASIRPRPASDFSMLATEWVPDRSGTHVDVTPADLTLVLASDESLVLAGVVAAAVCGELHQPDLASWDAGATLAESLGAEGHVRVIDLADLGDGVAATGRWQARSAVLQGLLARPQVQALDVVHVTRGLRGTSGSPETLLGAEMAGLVRMLGAEYRKASTRTIDVGDGDVAEIVTRELAHSGAADVCYRAGTRLVPMVVTVPVPGSADGDGWQLGDRTGAVVITGGTGGIGLAVARDLVSHGVTSLALMGRTVLPPREEWAAAASEPETPARTARTLIALLELQEAGVTVEVGSPTLTDRPALDEFLSGVRDRMGGIAGVVHCAGTVDRESFAFTEKNAADIAAVLEPKISGLTELHDALSDDDLAFVVLCSSVASYAPRFGVGMSDYAQANAFMDRFAEYHAARRPQTRYRSISWPIWQDTGMGFAPTASYLDAGLLDHSAEDGIRMLHAVLEQDKHVHVLPCRLAAPERLSSWFGGGESPAPQVAVPATPTAAPAPVASTQPLAGPVTDDLLDKLRRVFARELGMDAATIDEDRKFADYGVDSIFLVSLMRKVEVALDAKLDPEMFLSHPTLRLLSERLAAELAPSSDAPAEQPAPDAPREQPAPDAPAEQPAPDAPREQPAPDAPAEQSTPDDPQIPGVPHAEAAARRAEALYALMMYACLARSGGFVGTECITSAVATEALVAAGLPSQSASALLAALARADMLLTDGDLVWPSPRALSGEVEDALASLEGRAELFTRAVPDMEPLTVAASALLLTSNGSLEVASEVVERVLARETRFARLAAVLSVSAIEAFAARQRSHVPLMVETLGAGPSDLACNALAMLGLSAQRYEPDAEDPGAPHVVILRAGRLTEDECVRAQHLISTAGENRLVIVEEPVAADALSVVLGAADRAWTRRLEEPVDWVDTARSAGLDVQPLWPGRLTLCSVASSDLAAAVESELTAAEKKASRLINRKLLGTFERKGGRDILRHTLDGAHGETVEYFVAGEGEPVMLLTALGFTYPVWSNQIADLGADHCIIMPHLPGHAGSEYGSGRLSLDDIADTYAAILEREAPAGAHVVGWCLAGNVAQLMTLRHPELVRSLALVGTVHSRAQAHGLSREDLMLASRDPIAGYAVEFGNIYPDDRRAVNTYLRIVGKLHTELSERVAVNYVSRLFGFDEAERVGAIAVPTLMVSGRFDITYPPSQVEELADAIVGSEYRIFEHAGHMPFVNRPAEFNAALRSLFDRAQ